MAGVQVGLLASAAPVRRPGRPHNRMHPFCGWQLEVHNRVLICMYLLICYNTVCA